MHQLLVEIQQLYVEIQNDSLLEFWPRPGRIRPRTNRVAGDVPVSTGTLPPELICSWVFSGVIVDPL